MSTKTKTTRATETTTRENWHDYQGPNRADLVWFEDKWHCTKSGDLDVVDRFLATEKTTHSGDVG